MTRGNSRKSRTYWLYGKHAVEAALANVDRVVHKVLVTKNAANEMNLAKATIATSQEIEKNLQEGAVHQGVAAQVSPLADSSLGEIKDATRVLILDQVTDPHNIGAILRSCAAFGAAAVIVQDKNAPQENAVMAKTASGALEAIPLISVINLSTAMEELKEYDFWCIGMAGEAKDDISKISDYNKIAIVMGAEGKGIRRLVKENCDLLVKIPIRSSIESLNVSNAAAIALYELSR
jgi:23S rRNA (guanosine2251-2'-O)-methyltransferase